MKLNTNLDKDTFSMDINPEDGSYLFEVQDGIKLREYTDKNGNACKAISMNAKIVDIHGEGDHESVDLYVSNFCTVEKDGKEDKRGCKAIEAILVCTGTAERVIERFGEDVNLATEDFVEELNLRMQGCCFTAELKTGKTGFQNWNNYGKFSKGF